MKKFSLEIELGNDAMSSSAELAEALIKVANRIYDNEYVEDEDVSCIVRRIADCNGNTVGNWELK